jgi:hypothetical protein
MATYVELWDLQNDATFIKRVKFAILILASVQLASGGAQRKEWARKVFAGSTVGSPTNFVTLRVLSNATIASEGAGTSDATIQTTVNALLDELVALG